MSKNKGGAYRSAVSGRVTTAGPERAVTRGDVRPTTKESAARAEAAWKKASEATGVFQSKPRG
jgi:hypothetical protein